MSIEDHPIAKLAFRIKELTPEVKRQVNDEVDGGDQIINLVTEMIKMLYMRSGQFSKWEVILAAQSIACFLIDESIDEVMEKFIAKEMEKKGNNKYEA